MATLRLSRKLGCKGARGHSRRGHASPSGFAQTWTFESKGPHVCGSEERMRSSDGCLDLKCCTDVGPTWRVVCRVCLPWSNSKGSPLLVVARVYLGNLVVPRPHLSPGLVGRATAAQGQRRTFDGWQSCRFVRMGWGRHTLSHSLRRHALLTSCGLPTTWPTRQERAEAECCLFSIRFE